MVRTQMRQYIGLLHREAFSKDQLNYISKERHHIFIFELLHMGPYEKKITHPVTPPAQHRLPYQHDLTTSIKKKIKRILLRSLWEGISPPAIAQPMDSPITRLSAGTSSVQRRLNGEGL